MNEEQVVNTDGQTVVQVSLGNTGMTPQEEQEFLELINGMPGTKAWDVATYIGKRQAEKRDELTRIRAENARLTVSATDLLDKYSRWLEEHGYMDSDWYTEGNTVSEFLKAKK